MALQVECVDTEVAAETAVEVEEGSAEAMVAVPVVESVKADHSAVEGGWI